MNRSPEPVGREDDSSDGRVPADQPNLQDEPERLRRELRHRTRQLKESERRFRDIIERNADAIVVVDESGVIRFANPAAADLFGRECDSLVGTAFGFPMVAGETTELDLLPRGEPRVAEMRVVDSEWEGQTASIATLRDITERTRAEQDARRLEGERAARSSAEKAARRFRFLAESNAILSSSLDYAATLTTLARLCASEIADWAAVYAVDHGGALQRLEIAHRDPSKADIVRKIRDDPFSPEQLPAVAQLLVARRPLLASQVSATFLESFVPDAARRELIRELGVTSFILAPMVARNNLLGALALVSADPGRHFDAQDLSLAEDLATRAALAVDNARLYREAQLANQMKSDFLAVIAHDLRTPLSAIIGYTDLLEMGTPDRLPPGAADQVKRMRTSARHMVYLIDELVAFARLDGQQEEIRPREVDLRDIGREVAAVVEPLARERDLAFHLEVAAEPAVFRTDPDKLRQVLLNLAANAVKYTLQGEVRLEIAMHGDGGATLRVRDTGIGIAPDDLDRIFEPFWQVDRSQRSRADGAGLGLSVVRRLVGRLGGDVSVQSELGAGSTFTLRLPAM